MEEYTVPVYECENHCCIDARHIEEDRYTGTLYCTRCDMGAEVQIVGSRPAEYVSVAVYELDQEYGGPEEGGWWYNTGRRIDETLRCFTIADVAQVRIYKELLRARYITLGVKRPGQPRLEIRTYPEEVAPTSFPKTRPHYC